MQYPLIFGRLALLLCASVLLFSTVNGKSSQRAERAAALHEKKSALAKARNSHLQVRDAPKQDRYASKLTAPYKVDSLPFINIDVGELYAGRLPVGDDETKQMFFMYQPTVGAPVDEVTIWFNGGPGCSSLEAFLQENGRFIWSWGMGNAEVNQYSWVNLTNVLWVEYPLGLGFSTTNNVTATSEEETAADFVGFFKNFLKTFAIEGYKVYVTGESYAGRYVPYVASALIDEEAHSNFNVSGALMYDPVIGQYEYIGQTIAAVPFIQANAQLFNFNKTFMAQLSASHESCGYASYLSQYLTFPPPGPQPVLEGMYNQSSASCDVWTLAYNAAGIPNPCFNVYEVTTMCPVQLDVLGYPSDIVYTYSGVLDGQLYFNTSEVKKAIHVPEEISWQECSGPVFAGSGGPYGDGDSSLDPIQSVLPKVIEKTNRVLIANGDFDFELVTNGTLLSIQNMTWNGMLGFQQEPTTEIDIQLPDLQYAAAYVATGMAGLDGPGQGIMGIQHYERGLMWAETYQSGHMQPQFQPRSSYRHLQWMLGRIDAL